MLTDIEEVARRTLETFGRVDVLVNNARYIGPGHMDPFLETPIEILAAHDRCNVIGPLYLTQLLVPKMASTITSSANPSVVGQPVTFTATMTSIAGPPPDGEMVQFVVSGKVYGSSPLKGGVAKFTTSAIPLGSHIVVAKYFGDANYLPAKYTAVTQQVNP